MTRRQILASMPAVLYRRPHAAGGIQEALLDRHDFVQWSDARSRAPVGDHRPCEGGDDVLEGVRRHHLVVFSPNRTNASAPSAFQSICDCFNEIGSTAREMGFYAGLHNHMAQIVQNPDGVDRCMA